MTVKISKPAINLRAELASLKAKSLPKEDNLHLDNLVTNGDFSNGTTGWETAPAQTTFTVSGGAVTLTRNSNYGDAKQYLKTKAGRTYRLTYTVASVSHSYSVDLGSAQHLSSAITGTRVLYYTATSDSTLLKFAILNSSSGSLTFDNVSVQEVGENLVTNGVFSTNDHGWTSYHITGASGSVTSGVMTVTNGSSDHGGLVQNFKVKVGKSYTITGKVTGGTSTAKLLIGSSTGNDNLHNTTVAAGSTSTVNVTVVPTSANFYVSLQINSANGTGLYEDIVVTEGNHNVIQSIPYGYDVKDVYIDGELAREGEAYDYEVKTDGTKQWLKPTVEPTVTTETVVIGVRK
jgi:hypothetical protein